MWLSGHLWRPNSSQEQEYSYYFDRTYTLIKEIPFISPSSLLVFCCFSMENKELFSDECLWNNENAIIQIHPTPHDKFVSTITKK